MSGEREARAVGAGETIEVEGETYMLRPIVVQHLCDATREALRYHKRQYLQTFPDNADLLPDGKADELLAREMVKVAGWTVKDLPQLDAYSTAGLPVTEKACEWAREMFNAECDPGSEAGKTRVRALLATALDKGMVSAEEVAEMCGQRPVCGKVRFDNWWSTATEEGMACFVHSSLRRDHPDVTRQDVTAWPAAKLIEAARLVESITSVDLKNG